MKISDFQNEVARRVDTDKTQISVAETKRVLSEAFLVLAGLDAADDLSARRIARCIAHALVQLGACCCSCTTQRRCPRALS